MNQRTPHISRTITSSDETMTSLFAISSDGSMSDKNMLKRSFWNENTVGKIWRTILPGVLASGNLTVSRKSVSNVTSGNPVRFERANRAASEIPFGEDTKSWPRSIAERISGRDRFSSAKNFTCVGGYADNSVSFCARGRNLQSGTDMLLCNRRPCVDNRFYRLAMRKSIKHLPDHHSCSFEGQCATGDVRVGYNVAVCIRLFHTLASIPHNLIAQRIATRLHRVARVCARGLILFALLTSAPLAHASATSGTIDSAYKYAWSNVGGYVNFAPTNGGLTITDSAITGYAWSANTGWLNFSASQSHVTNDGAGNLGGFAWDAGGGWVAFAGVTIDSSGKFHGQATGGTVAGASYTLTFDCTNCDVRTDWRPASSRPVASSGGGGGCPSGSVWNPATVSCVSAAGSSYQPVTTPPSSSGASPTMSLFQTPFGTSNPATQSPPISPTPAPAKKTIASSTIRVATTTVKKSIASSFFNFIRSVARSIYSGVRAFLRFFWRF
jgi:hypothetical protein